MRKLLEVSGALKATDPVSRMKSPSVRVAGSKLAAMASVSASVVTGEAVAALPPEKQIELGIRRFKGIGLDENSDADDYAMANAAPAYVGRPDKTPIKEYASGTPDGDDVRAKNPGWIPEGGGEITVGSIKAFYRRHRGGGGASEAAEPAAKARTKEDQAALDLMR